MIEDLAPAEARDRIEADPDRRILEVRTRAEGEGARLPGSRLLTEDLAEELVASWDRERFVLVLCHHGIRSKVVAYRLRGAGFTNVLNLAGGLDAWSQEVDPGLPRYKICPGGGVRPR